MALSIDQIRNYAAGGSLAITNADGEEPARIQKTGFWHWVGSVLGVRSSRTQNADTLQALRTAIQNDPRYFASNVQNRANELIAGVRINTSIDAARIKGIISELDEMSTPSAQFQAVRNVAVARLATTELPPRAVGMEMKYKGMAATFAAFCPEGGTYASIDVSARLTEFQTRMNHVFERLGDNPDVNDLFRAYAGKNILCNERGVLKSEEDLDRIVDDIKRVVDELDEIGNTHGEQARANVLATVRVLSRPLPANRMKDIVAGGAAMAKCGLDRLNANSSAAEIHDAIAKIVKSLPSTMKALAFETDDPFVMNCVQELAGVGLASSLTAEQKKNVLDAFKSEQGANLLSLYATNSVMGGHSVMTLVNILFGFLTQLNTDVNKAPPRTMLDAPENYDVSKLPVDAIADIAPHEAASGAGAKKFIDKLVKAPGSPVTGLDDPKLKTRMNKIASNNLTIHFAQQVNEVRDGSVKKKVGKPDFNKMNNSFYLDLRRAEGLAVDVVINGKKVTLPPDDVEKARDILTRLFTGNDNAVFAEQDEKTKAKIYMIMSCLHQGTVAAVQGGVSMAFSPEKNYNPFYVGGNPKVAFTVEINENKDVEIGMTAHLGKRTDNTVSAPIRMISQRSDDPAEILVCDENAYIEYSAKITLPTASMDEFIDADWENYNHGDVKNAAGKIAIPDHKGKAVELIPEKCRCPFNVDVSFHLHAENVNSINENIAKIK